MTSSTRRLLCSLGALALTLLPASEAHAITESYCSFPASLTTFTFNQNAFEADNTVIRLTTDIANETGSAWITTPIPLTAATSVMSHFRFEMGPTAAGGDGLAFVMQNATAGAAALGTGGADMGYGGLSPSVVVQFATYKNVAADPNANVVSIILNGSTTARAASATPSFVMGNAGVINAWVDYDSVGKMVHVYLAQADTKPGTALVSAAVTLSTQLGAQMFVGFTAATNTATEINEHDIYSLELSTTGTPCSCDGDTACSGTTPACATSGICTTCSATNGTECTGATTVCDVPTNSCVGCLTNANCSGATPICGTTDVCRACVAADCTGTLAECASTGPHSGQCVICTADAQCPMTTPRCAPTTNTCVQCLASTDCGGDTPICTSGVCKACASDSDCGGATPACEVWGACGQCTAANGTACTGGDSVCDYPTGTCVACEFNSDCSGSLPTCNTTTHMCQPCASNADCVNNPAGDACVTSGMKMGSCVLCAADSDCTSAAAPKCDTVANQCVACLTSGDCMAPTPVCDPSNLCVGCLTATDCSATAPVCDTTSSLCTACSNDYSSTNPGPLPCPTSALPACQPTGTTLAGQCAVCSSTNDSACVTEATTPVCVAASATCGCAKDTDCNANSYCDTTTVSTGVCTTGCRVVGDGGVDNCATGEYCTEANGSVGTCMTQPCNSNTDCKAPDPVCNTTVQPHSCAACLNDVDCPTGKVCDATNQCAACTPNQTGNCKASGAGAACLANETCGCATDADCGTATSGRVCNAGTHACETGCRGSGGNGCQPGDTCSSKGSTAGKCSGTATNADAGTPTTTKDAGPSGDASIKVDNSGSGCGCRTAPARDTGKGVVAGVLLGLVLVARRRRSASVRA
jgi:hypothetical protein